MEIFQAGVEVMQLIVGAVGGMMVIGGLIAYLMAHSDSSPAQKMVGMTLIVAGAGICLVAVRLVPMLPSAFA